MGQVQEDRAVRGTGRGCEYRGQVWVKYRRRGAVRGQVQE